VITSPGKLSGSARYGALLVVASMLAGCSIRSLAIDALAESLAESGDVFASDEDPELVRQAVPFALKTIESLLAEKPDHPGLLLAACSGFTQYGYAFVESDAAYLEEQDYEASEAQYQRALKLYLRARDYCLRALERVSPGVRRALEAGDAEALAAFERADVPLLFWSGASWGAAISVALDRPEIAIDVPAVRTLIARSLELDETWDAGSVHEVMMSLEALPEAMGGSTERAIRHFDRAVELSGGKRASPYLGLARGVALPRQDRAEFERLLHEALAVDVDADPSRRLANIVAQRRAAFLKDRIDDLFLPEEEGEGAE
jgi:predicted anti-sigma-YlaC factor YlaD